MKIAYLLGSLNRGGTETLLLDVFRNANLAPYDMIGIHRKDGAYRDDFYTTGSRIIQCAPKRLGLLRYLCKLRKILIGENITVVHAQQSLDCVYAWLVTIGTKIRVIETFHGYDLEAKQSDKWINALSIRMADAVCFVSAAERDYYIDAYKIRNTEKLHVVYNGVDFAKIDSAKPSLEFANQQPKKIYGKIDSVPQRRIRLAMVGNFVSGRSQNIIAKSIHALKEQGITNFDFYFIGRRVEAEAWRYDDCVNYCDENQLDNVHFLGGRGDVPSLLKVMDGFVYSTDHDTFGIAVVEALAAGLPVVVNDWEVMREVTRDGEWATLFRTNDVEDCAKAMRMLIENIDEAKKRARTIAPKVRKAYSIEAHMQRLSEIYWKL